MAPKRRGRVSFTDATFADSTSLTTLPEVDRTPAFARLDALAHNPHNPRSAYEGEALDELAASLLETGQLQPVTVVSRDVFLAHYPDSTDAVGSARWVVLTGNRRFAAARKAGVPELAITVADRLGGQDPRLSEATLIENLHREALPPLLEARELQALVERHGSQEAAAKRIAKSQGWVSQRLSLLKLTPELQAQVDSRNLSVREARGVAGAPPEQQATRLAELRGETISDEAPPIRSRRGRKPAPPDVDRIARDLRRRLSDSDLVRLVDLLDSDG